MVSPEKITSTKNPLVKFILSLQKSSERKKQNLFVIEGIKEIEKAINNGFTIKKIIHCGEVSKGNIPLKLPKVETIEVSLGVFQKIAYRENSVGILVIAEPKKLTFNDLQLPENGLILVLEGIEKPGNIGAILRTADAAGIDAVLVTNPKSDLYNPNIIRSSLGCVFSIPIIVSKNAEAIEFLNSSKTKIYSTYLEASVPYTNVDFSSKCAIVVGTENIGISPDWVNASTQNIIIPMHGDADSLNVSTATAIVLFEAVRQRELSLKS